MATLYIREYETIPTITGHAVQIAYEPGSVDQTVGLSGTSAQSSAFNTKTKYVGVIADGIFSYVVGTNPTATTTNFRVPADQILYFAVPEHSTLKIAAITNT